MLLGARALSIQHLVDCDNKFGGVETPVSVFTVDCMGRDGARTYRTILYTAVTILTDVFPEVSTLSSITIW